MFFNLLAFAGVFNDFRAIFYAFIDENHALLRYYSGIAKTAFFQTCIFCFYAQKQ
jgi:hypothetical protein